MAQRCDGDASAAPYYVYMDIHEKKRIMIVEDDPMVTRMMRLALRTDGFDTCSAADGLVALDELGRCRPDAIILDMHMPVMDGRTFYREIRSRGCTTPVLIVSADDASGAARELHADGYLPKPFNPEDLVTRVAGLCAVA